MFMFDHSLLCIKQFLIVERTEILAKKIYELCRKRMVMFFKRFKWLN